MQRIISTKLQLWALKSCLHIVCLVPALWQFYLATNDNLGADPVKALIHFYGIGAIHCLFATLLVSPLARMSKTPMLMQCRRLLGLYCALYASLHILCFLVFEWQLQWSLVLAEVIQRPYITIGFVAWLILLALTTTSLKTIQRKMGSRWGQLHSLVYLALALGLSHFYWSQKSPWSDALAYLIAGSLLLYFKRRRLWLWLKLFTQRAKS